MEKMVDHSTNGPRNFSRSSERMKSRKEKGQFFVKILKAVLIDSHH